MSVVGVRALFLHLFLSLGIFMESVWNSSW